MKDLRQPEEVEDDQRMDGGLDGRSPMTSIIPARWMQESGGGDDVNEGFISKFTFQREERMIEGGDESWSETLRDQLEFKQISVCVCVCVCVCMFVCVFTLKEKLT